MLNAVLGHRVNVGKDHMLNARSAIRLNRGSVDMRNVESDHMLKEGSDYRLNVGLDLANKGFIAPIRPNVFLWLDVCSILCNRLFETNLKSQLMGLLTFTGPFIQPFKKSCPFSFKKSGEWPLIRPVSGVLFNDQPMACLLIRLLTGLHLGSCLVGYSYIFPVGSPFNFETTDWVW